MKKIRDLLPALVFSLMWLSILTNNIFLFFFSLGLFCGVILYKKAVKHATLFFCCLKQSLHNLLSGFLSYDLKISGVSQDAILYLVKPIATLKVITQLQNKTTRRLEQEIRESGIAANPAQLGMQSTSYMILAAIIAVPVAITASIILDDVAPLVLSMLLPVAVFSYPSLKLKMASSDRKSQIQDELAFFAAYSGIMQGVGRSMYHSISEIPDASIFKTLEQESRMLQRNTKIFAMDGLSAMNHLAMNHPNHTFRNLLLGYVSISKSGGDLARYLESKAGEYFDSLKFRMAQYSSQAGTIGETMLILLNILPVLLISSSFLMPANSVQMLTNASFVVVPFVTGIMILVTDHSQPKTKDTVPFSMLGVVAGAITGAAAIVSGNPAWQALLLCVIAAGLVNCIFTFKRFQEIRFAESALADFVRDITENAKIGIAIPNSIIRISKERNYNDYFDSLLSDISSKIAFGYKLSDITKSAEIQSWNARLVFFILGKIADSGGPRPQTLEYVTNFVSKVHNTKKETLSTIRVFAIMVYASPVLMVWMTKVMADVMTTLGPSFQALGNGNNIFSATPEFIGTINMLIATSCICMGAVISKAQHFTIKNTTGVTITSAVTFVAIYFSDYLPSLDHLFGI